MTKAAVRAPGEGRRGTARAGRAVTRRVALRSALGAAGVAGVACAGPGGGAESGRPPGDVSGTVEFWHSWTTGSLNYDWLPAVKERFRERAPRVQVTETFAAPLNEFHPKVTAAAAGGTAPDVTYGDMYTAPVRGLTGENRSLDALLKRDKITLGDLVDYQARRVLYDGKPYALPFRPDTRVLFSNRALMRASGLDPDRPPATWDDLWAQAERGTKGAGSTLDPLGFYPAGPAGALGNVWFWTFAWTNGAAFVDAQNAPTVNGRPQRETAEWFVRWARRYDHGAVVQWGNDLNAGGTPPFMQGKQVFIVNTNGFSARLRRDVPALEWSAALIPSRTRKASWGAGFDLELPAGGRQPDAAWEWARFLDFDPEVNRQAIQVTANLVALKAVNASPEFARDPFWKTVVDSLAVTEERPPLLVGRELVAWTGPLNTHVTAACEGTESVNEALDKAQAEVTAAVEKNRPR
ncbi:MAG TPA: extracellular solute-binding protein [Chloroflexota bacterium]|nr:extracellular solute-binding protein [Chloroflexota bacterium]